MKKTFSIILILLGLNYQLTAQYQLNVLAGFDVVEPLLNHSKNSFVFNHLKKRDGSLAYVYFNGKIQLRNTNNWSFELGYQRLIHGVQLDSSSSFVANLQHGFLVDYHSVGSGATKYFQINDNLHFYISTGITWNFINDNTHIVNLQQIDDKIHEFNVLAKKQYLGFVVETGITYKHFFMGLIYNQAFSKILSCHFTESKNDIVINTDYLSSNGINIGLVLRYAITIKKDFNIEFPQILKPIYKLNKVKHKEK